MRQTIVFLVVFLLAPVADLAAQQDSPVRPGSRIRIKAPSAIGHELMGTLVVLHADTLMLKVEGVSNPLSVSVASIAKLEVSRGRKSPLRGAWKGAGKGFLYGVGTGALIGAVGGAIDGENIAYSIYMGLFFGAFYGPPIGAVTGAVHAFASPEQWKEVPLDRLRVGLVPQRRGGLVLLASLSF